MARQKISELRQQIADLISELSVEREGRLRENNKHMADRILLLEENSKLKDQLITLMVPRARPPLSSVKTSRDVPKQNSPELNENNSGNYRVQLTSYGRWKIHCIKVLRNYRSIGLKDAKNLIESAPCVLFQGNEATAHALEKDLTNHLCSGDDVKCHVVKVQ